MNIIQLIDAVKEVKQAIKDVEPALLYYAGTPTGDAISKLIEFSSGLLSALKKRLVVRFERLL